MQIYIYIYQKGKTKQITFMNLILLCFSDIEDLPVPNGRSYDSEENRCKSGRKLYEASSKDYCNWAKIQSIAC